MGSMSEPEPPPAPDYRGAAEATSEGNRELVEAQTWANRPNQVTPWGSTTWSATPTVDPTTGTTRNQWEQRLNLTPESQAALDAQLDVTKRKSQLGQGMMGRLEDEFADPMDWTGFQEYGAVPGSGMEARNKAEDALYGRATSRLDPQWEQRMDDAKATMVAQGLRPGDPAYDREMENLTRDRTDAYQQAQYGATVGGGAEATQQQGRDLTSANYANQLRKSQMAEELQKRGFDLNEINAVLSGQQVAMPSMPDFNQAGRSQAADYMGAAQAGYGGAMDAFNAEQAHKQGMMGGMMDLASLGTRAYTGGMFG